MSGFLFDVACLAGIVGLGLAAYGVGEWLERGQAQGRDTGWPCDRRERDRVRVLPPVYDRDADR